MAPRGSHSAQGSPTALLKSCLSIGVWRRRGKPCRGRSSPSCLLPPPCIAPSLPVPLHLQKQLQGLSLAVQAPAPQISLLLFPLCSSRLLGEGFWGFDKYSLFHIGFPLPGAVLLRQWCFQQCQHCSNKVFTGSQLCQAPHTLGRVL